MIQVREQDMHTMHGVHEMHVMHDWQQGSNFYLLPFLYKFIIIIIIIITQLGHDVRFNRDAHDRGARLGRDTTWLCY